MVPNSNDTALDTFQHCWNRAQKSKQYIPEAVGDNQENKYDQIRVVSMSLSLSLSEALCFKCRIRPSWKHKLVFHMLSPNFHRLLSTFHSSHDFFESQKIEFTFFLGSYRLITTISIS